MCRFRAIDSEAPNGLRPRLWLIAARSLLRSPQRSILDYILNEDILIGAPREGCAR